MKFEAYAMGNDLRPSWYTEAFDLLLKGIPFVATSTLACVSRQTAPQTGSWLFTVVVGKGFNSSEIELWQVSSDGVLFRAADEVLNSKGVSWIYAPLGARYLSAVKEALGGLSKFFEKNSTQVDLKLDGGQDGVA